MAERPDRAVTFVDNHDFRGGDQALIINDKLMAYAFILTHPGYPCVFWKDYFEDALGQPGGPRGITALVARARAQRRGRTRLSVTSTTISTSWSGRAGERHGPGVRAQQPG